MVSLANQSISSYHDLTCNFAGVISTSDNLSPRCAIAIGDDALDLAKYAKAGRLSNLEAGHNYSFEKLFSEVNLIPTV